ncbi:YdiU family protein [Aestuariivirga litoralis]|uniref:Protein nucleotidyltransferase YdiU n=1 Tax=Aestuariivirga litoralis TaxID=2650924 RepID=A0A2W2C8D5_9HYPH|nr:YdiU family protein [Aestuariivirga litoralis]PZF76473.1 YdiU family protein [Aestuariivirga litoralis]
MNAIAFDNSYARLPGSMHVGVAPTPVSTPRLVRVNEPLARELAIDPALLTAEVAVGNAIPAGASPLAQAYAGHQFGNFVPQLGDGRAILLGEVVDVNGRRRDIQLKGSGRTPFSRGGDGRAALGPVLREYLVSEAMNALGIPTTRALMAATTGERVYRDAVLPGAVLTRVAASHIRVGTFQFFAVRQDFEALKLLVDHVIDRHYPQLKGAENPALALLDAVMEAQAALVARWVQVGFIHGVMNTDNTSISGETIDYGPCAFMDAYDPGTVFSSIDTYGRYAYANQAPVAQWNLARLAETLLAFIAPDREEAIRIATERIEAFPAIYTKYWLAGFRKKIGLVSEEDGDLDLIQAMLDAMQMVRADFTVTFRALSNDEEPEALRDWLPTWRERLARDPQSAEERRAFMRSVNPVYIPRNHLVEEMISAGVERQDYRPFEEMLRVLMTPYEEQPGAERYAAPPAEVDGGYRTFCGT